MAITILVIILYYIREFYLSSAILIIYVLWNAYSDIDKQLYNEKVDTLTTRIKANINDNISNMLYPLALIDDEGNILWANKRLKEELNLLDLKEQNILSIGRNLDLQKLLKSIY